MNFGAGSLISTDMEIPMTIPDLSSVKFVLMSGGEYLCTDGEGLTTDPDRAGRYTVEEAMELAQADSTLTMVQHMPDVMVRGKQMILYYQPNPLKRSPQDMLELGWDFTGHEMAGADGTVYRPMTRVLH